MNKFRCLCLALATLTTASLLLAETNHIKPVRNIEDLVTIPGTDWIIASSMAMGDQAGGLYAIHAVDHRIEPLTLTATSNSPCSGPPAFFAPHGLSLVQQADKQFALYVVNHGTRESVEVFNLNLEQPVTTPTLAFNHCLKLPPDTSANSVVATENGTVYLTTSSTLPASKNSAAPTVVMMKQPDKPWQPLLTSSTMMTNGIAISSDGGRLFVADWIGKTVVEFDIQQQALTSRSINIDFLADNLRWQNDNQLWLAGQATTPDSIISCYLSENEHCPGDWGVARFDTRTMAKNCEMSFAGNDEFGSGTTALAVDDGLWIGTVRGNAVQIIDHKTIQAHCP